jgi:hypothetical protein
MESSTGSLLKTIESFIKFSHIAKMLRIFMPTRLSHINIFIENDTEKHIFHIELMHLLVLRDIKRANSYSFYHSTECILIVNTISLFKPFLVDECYIYQFCHQMPCATGLQG